MVRTKQTARKSTGGRGARVIVEPAVASRTEAEVETVTAIMEKAQKDVARIMEKAMKDVEKLEGASPKSKATKGDDLKSKVLAALAKSKTKGQSYYRVDDGKIVTRRGAARTANTFYSKGGIHICGSSAAKLRAPMKELGLTERDDVEVDEEDDEADEADEADEVEDEEGGYYTSPQTEGIDDDEDE